jgi:hypothetical protein
MGPSFEAFEREMVRRLLTAGVLVWAVGCGSARPPIASNVEPRTMTACHGTIAAAGWNDVSDAQLLALVVPGYDSTTGTAPSTRWRASNTDALLAGVASSDGVVDCSGRIHPALRPGPTSSARVPIAIATRTALHDDRLAFWIATGQDSGFCAPGLGFVAIVTRHARDVVATTLPLRLGCLDVPKRFETVVLGTTELLLVEDGSGSEHGGRQLFHAIAMRGGRLEPSGTFEGSGEEGIAAEGAVRKIESTRTVRGDALVVTDTWTDESCESKDSEAFTCTLTSRGRAERRFVLRDWKLVAAP